MVTRKREDKSSPLSNGYQETYEFSDGATVSMQVVAGAGLPDMRTMRHQYQQFLRSNHISANYEHDATTEGAVVATESIVLGNLGQGETVAENIQRLFEERIRNHVDNQFSNFYFP